MSKFVHIVILTFFISMMGSFFSIGTPIFVATRYLSAVLIIICSLLQYESIKIKKTDISILVSLLSVFTVVPLSLVVFNIYSYGVYNIILNSSFYILIILTTFCIGSFYKINRHYNLFVDISFLVSTFLIIGALMFRDINFNIPSLIVNLVNNERTARSYLGFSNPNQVGIFAGIGIVTSFLSPQKNKIKIIKNLLFLFVIINTGSRTPLFSIFFGILFFMILKLKRNVDTKVYQSITIFILIIFLVAIIDPLVKYDASIFDIFDKLSTNRLSRQLYTINYLSNVDKLAFGLGMFNTSFFNSNMSFMKLHTDSYYTYILATMGGIGLIGNLLIISKIHKKTKIENNDHLYLLLIYCLTYAFFEGTLFFPTSFLTVILLSFSFFSYREEVI